MSHDSCYDQVGDREVLRGETVWYRIVGRRRVKRDDVLPARSGRFHEDSGREPTSYLGDSLLTVWKEAQAARAGVARLDVEAFAGWKVTVRGGRFADFRDDTVRKEWGVDERDLLGDPAPPICRTLARSLRRSNERIHGLLYRSVRNPPAGVCLALFLEAGGAFVRVDPVPEKEWGRFIRTLGRAEE